MSHLSTIRTVLTDLRWLKLALADLDCTFGEGGTVKRNHEKFAVQLKLNSSAKLPVAGELGFTASESGEIECVADWHGSAGVVNHPFLQAVTQRYAYHVVKEKLAEQGFLVDQESMEAGKEIHLVMRRVS